MLGSLAVAFILISNTLKAQGDFISAEEASALIKANKATVISARSEADYAKSHVSGAINLQHKELYKSGDIEGVLKPPAELAAIFSEKGIPSDQTLIIYDDGTSKYSGRLYWIFKYMGVKDVKMLHKDMDQWKTARIMITKMPTKAKKTNVVANPQENIITSTEYVKAHLKDPKVVIVDVRKSDEYAGTSTNPKSKGHISGAVNLNYETLLNADGSLKSKNDLEKLTSAIGLSPEKEVILYCATSVRAGVVYNILTTVLGYKNVKVYEGAYNEWVSNPSNPLN